MIRRPNGKTKSASLDEEPARLSCPPGMLTAGMRVGVGPLRRRRAAGVHGGLGWKWAAQSAPFSQAFHSDAGHPAVVLSCRSRTAGRLCRSSESLAADEEEVVADVARADVASFSPRGRRRTSSWLVLGARLRRRPRGRARWRCGRRSPTTPAMHTTAAATQPRTATGTRIFGVKEAHDDVDVDVLPVRRRERRAEEREPEREARGERRAGRR